MNVPLAAAVAFVLTLAAVLAAGGPVIRYLHGMRYGQTAYEDAPKSHAVKTGTPTMGGLLFAVALLVAFALRPRDLGMLALVVAGVGFGAVGFIDDYAKVVRRRNKGLGARAKFGLTIVVAVAFLALAIPAMAGEEPGVIASFGHTGLRAPLWLFAGLAVLALLATTHAVNLTDGLDGLAGGCVLPPLALLTLLALFDRSALAPSGDVAVMGAALVAAVLGFLRFNRYPARLFMGDTGALALGGILAGSAILMGNVLLLPLIGGVFAAEALSVILQVAYFKRTGKRIFRMSPLHHHFELAGWPETRVTHRFWTASALLSLAGAAIVR